MSIPGRVRPLIRPAAAEASRLVKEPRHRAQFFQISTGLGAGNVGDDLMAQAFWAHLPADYRLDVEVFPAHVLHRERYPDQYNYRLVNELELEGWNPASAPGLLACGTPVNETEGLAFPMEFVGQRLRQFAARDIPVDAVGVGIDRLHSKRARSLFQSSFLGVRSWTVRTPDCREALTDLGVEPQRVIVGADWAWLYRRKRDLRDWGAEMWTSLGIDLERPLLMANLVNLVWRSRLDCKREIAKALDALSTQHGYQIAFFCNECRDGELFDRAAAEEVKSLMRSPAVLVPNHYWSPDEVLGLTAHANVVVSQRYHFSVFAVLAGTVPVSILRGCKMRGLVEELGTPASCRIERVDSELLLADILEAHRNRSIYLERLLIARRQLAIRAGNNLAFFGQHYR
jgi:polysaccharide pyruvyl transferase WcaK-like protein